MKWVPGFTALVLWPGIALAQGCLSDEAIDRALGQQVRSGAPFLNTSTVPDGPLCSGLTLAQAIQRIRAAAFPDEQIRGQALREALITREQPALPRPEPIPTPAPVLPPAPRVIVAKEIEPAQPLASGAARHHSSPAASHPVRAHHAAVRVRSSGGYFSSCREARAAGAAPVRRGDPGYSGRLDRDNDGIACE